MSDQPWHDWKTGRPCRCRKFMRRIRPQGITVLCGEAVTHETWSVGPEGQEVYHGGWCAKHKDTAIYGPKAGWRTEDRKIPDSARA